MDVLRGVAWSAASDGRRFALLTGPMSPTLAIVNADGTVAIPQKPVNAAPFSVVVGDGDGFVICGSEVLSRFDHDGGFVRRLIVDVPNPDELTSWSVVPFAGGLLALWRSPHHSVLARLDAAVTNTIEPPFAVDAIEAIAPAADGNAIAITSSIVDRPPYGEAAALS